MKQSAVPTNSSTKRPRAGQEAACAAPAHRQQQCRYLVHAYNVPTGPVDVI